MSVDLCVACGEIVPEGYMVCPKCMNMKLPKYNGNEEKDEDAPEK